MSVLSDQPETVTDTGSVELFRLAAIRPPRLALGTVPVINVVERDRPDGDPPVVANPATGLLNDFWVTIRDVAQNVPLGELDGGLASRNDAWDPGEIRSLLETAAKSPLEAIIETYEWRSLRSWINWSLISALAHDGDIAQGEFARPMSMLRARRVMALIEFISVPSMSPANAADVQRFLRYATIQLPSRLLAANPNVLARPPAIADLKVVRLGPPRYEPGAIAHIENVLASEKRERTHRIREENEQTTTQDTERTEDTEHDLTTTSNLQMQQEAMQTISSSTDVEAGLKVSASYGPTVSVNADARLARHDSTESVNQAAASLSNSITQSAKQRVIERTRETRTVRHLLETEETNTHGFDNSAPDSDNITGVYRYVEQVQDAWMENYGKRLMLEFVIPEPAAVLQWAMSSERPAPNDIEPPKPKNPMADEDLSPEDINEQNYLQLVGLYGASNVKAPPPPSVDIAVSYMPATGADLYLFEDSKTLKVPDGFRATSWSAQCVTWGAGGPDHSWMVGVGEPAQPQENNNGAELRKHLSGPVDAEQGSTLPVVMLGRGLLRLAASVRVRCERTDNALNDWKLDVFDKVMTAWENAHQDWEARKARADALAQADDMDGLLQGSADPEQNRTAERRELRRSVIHMLLGYPEDTGAFAGKAVDRPADARPALDLAAAATERDWIQFFEQAFEWPNMTWVHYPYYWADGSLWADSIRRTAGDPFWAAFLSAGASRVAVPVRPGFESAVGLFLATGVIWSGGQVPTVGDPAYLGIAEEIAESLGTGEVEPERTPLEPVRLPTQLIWLQPTGELNPESAGPHS